MAARGTFIIRTKGPNDFLSSYSFYRRSKFESVDWFGDNTFVRPLQYSGQPVLIEVSGDDSRQNGSIRVKWNSPDDMEDIKGFKNALAEMFYADFDLTHFYGHRTGRELRRLINRHPGFRPILTPSIFEAASWAIIGQQINLQFAYKIKSRIVEYVNRFFDVGDRHCYLFPSAAEIAGISKKKLYSFQLSQRKAEYLHDFAQMVASGNLDLQQMKRQPYEDALQALLAIRGIGPWSANYILLRGAGHRDAFPIGDSGINRAVINLYKLEQKPSPEFLEKISRAWRPYRSLATFYLWKSLQGEK